MDPLVWPVSTKRLQLRPARPQDVEDVFAYHRLDEVARYQLWDPRTRQDVAERIAFWERLDGSRQSGGLALCVVLKQTGTVIGDLHLDYDPSRPDHGEIGFCFHVEQWGKGYATEAGHALIELAFDQFDCDRISGRCKSGNKASWTLMERLGMQKHTQEPDVPHASGDGEGEALYVFLKSDWRVTQR